MRHVRIGFCAVAILAIGGCGNSNSSSTSTTSSGRATTPRTSSSSSALASTCGQVQSQALAIGGDAGGLSNPNAGSGAADKAASDADTLKTTLTVMRGEVKSPAKQAQIDQYLGVISSFRQSVQAYASGDYQTAVGQLTGIATEFGQMLKGLQSMCTV